MYCKAGKSTPTQWGPFLYMLILDGFVYFFLKVRNDVPHAECSMNN